MQISMLGVTALLVLITSTMFAASYAEIYGVVYSVNSSPPNNDIGIDSKIISKFTKVVRIYDNNLMEQTVIQFYEVGVDVYMGINVSSPNFDKKLDDYIDIAKRHPNVIAIILESDPVTEFSETEIIKKIHKIQDSKIKATVASIPNNWKNMPSVLKEVDFPYYYMFDFWNGFSASQAYAKLEIFHENVKDLSPVYEVGYPDGGKSIGNAIPSPHEQKKFIEKISDFEGNAILFSYSTEPHKEFKFGFEDNTAERHFNIFENGKVKYDLPDLVPKKKIDVEKVTIDEKKKEFIPKFSQDRTQVKQLQNIVELNITGEKGKVDIHYSNQHKTFNLNYHLKIFLDIKDYDTLRIIGESVESIEFFEVPMALAQCNFDDENCAYIQEEGNYSQHVLVGFASIVIFGIVIYKFKKKYDKSSGLEIVYKENHR